MKIKDIVLIVIALVLSILITLILLFIPSLFFGGNQISNIPNSTCIGCCDIPNCYNIDLLEFRIIFGILTIILVIVGILLIIINIKEKSE